MEIFYYTDYTCSTTSSQILFIFLVLHLQIAYVHVHFFFYYYFVHMIVKIEHHNIIMQP